MPEDLLSGLTLLSFESRRAAEIGQLIAGYGGTTISAPSMREIPLAENTEVRRFLDELRSGAIDIVVLLTGVGTQALIEILSPRCPAQQLCQLLQRPTIVARGPKPRAALRSLGREPDHTVAEPNTWREIISLLENLGPLAGKRIAIQEYGRANDELLQALRSRGAEVLSVPVYRWGFPLDLEPLRAGVRDLAAGRPDVALFTSAQQCVHAMQVARELGLDESVRAATSRLAVASVGPICSEALRGAGLPVDIEPSKPKMGPLIRQIAVDARAVLARKRRQHPC